MQQPEGQPESQQGQKFRFNNKLVIILGSVVALVFLILLVLLLPGTSKEGKDLPSNPTTTPQQNALNPSQSGNNKFNPLVNPAEVDKVESALRKKMQSEGAVISPKPEYKFQYQLDPQLQGKSSFLPIQSVYAANTCNISVAPTTLNVYTLKSHLNIVDAKKIAAEYNMTGEPSGSLPSPDGTSFEYFFSDPVVSQFLKISEPSGVTYWHRVIKEDPQKDIGPEQAQTISRQELDKHNLLDKAGLKKSGIDPATTHYIFNYEKKYDNFIMTDKSSIAALGTSTSACSVGPTTQINYIDTSVTKNGYIQKIMNKTRKALQSYTVKRASLEDAVKEYQANPPIEPIVIGGTSPTGNVTIDEAVLVWYDYGELFPQTAYVPMYLTSGKTTDGARVLTLFPAVSGQELKNTPIPNLSGSRDVLQLYTFNPPPPNKPPAPKNPLSGTPYPTIPGMEGTPSSCGGLGFGGICSPGSPVGGCFGGLVDYIVSCRDSSGVGVCQEFTSLPTDGSGKNDPWGVCKNGCQTKSGTIDVPAGSNPCTEFMKQNNLPPSSDTGFGGFNKHKGGPVQCQIEACPC